MKNIINKILSIRNIKTIPNELFTPCGIISDLPDSFKTYYLEHDMCTKINALKNNLDEHSVFIIENFLQKTLHLPDTNYSEIYKTSVEELEKFFDKPLEKLIRDEYFSNIPLYRERYKLPVDFYDVEVFYFHHGLKHSNSSLRNYIKNKDFIDAGAYIGDSALVLLEYEPSKIYSFEISEKNVINYYKTMHMNNIEETKYKLIQKGLAEKEKTMYFNDISGQGEKKKKNGKNCIDCIDLDSFVFRNNLRPGFIKADVEGNLFEVLLGAEKTIKRYRPVLSLAIYHNPKEFFDSKPLLDKFVYGLNYQLTINSHHPFCDSINGTVLWGYPKELGADNFFKYEIK